MLAAWRVHSLPVTLHCMGQTMREHYTPPAHHRISKRLAREQRTQAVADYLVALAVGLALTALALAYFDIL
jgi:hypothetical protein